MLASRHILLVISGGIAAYKSLELIRLLKRSGARVTPVLTRAAEEFVTPLSVSALAGQKVYRDLFDLTDEAEMGHIELSRSADLIVVAAASADLMAKMATGQANDLATTLLLATDTPVMIAPAMNVRMWDHPATQRNLKTLKDDGIGVVGPNSGDMACGEYGPGRMSEPTELLNAIEAHFAQGPLTGRHVLITSGPTHEPIDPVRYIANRSSGTQGTAIAEACVAAGARVTFVTGPAQAPRPIGADVVEVETAKEMHSAVMQSLPADIAVMAAAVADFAVQNASGTKVKKKHKNDVPDLTFIQNPDILGDISSLDKDRPPLVIGFAAETDDVLQNATEKRLLKGCDWIVANDVSAETGIMGGAENAIILVTDTGAETWPRMAKGEVGKALIDRVVQELS